MALAATLKKMLCEPGAKTATLRGTIALSSNYATGGETFNLTAFAGFPVKKDAQAQVAIWGSSGYNYGWVPGADLSAGKILLRSGTTELTAGAYPAGVTGDTIQFEVVIPKVS